MNTDPRNLRGDMAGPGGPHDLGGVVLDARRALLLETIDVSTVELRSGRSGPSGLAMLLGGRINRSQDRAQLLFLFGTDGAAAIITQLIALIGRASGPEVQAEFVAEVMRRMAELDAGGNLT
jgi:hypothetical protein